MYYYIYKITNLVNNKIYIGVHRTTNLDDGYMGSGSMIKSAIAKHGIENFEKTIIKFFENPKDMYLAEAEIVTDDFLSRDDVYNLRRGGHGGFDHIIKSGKHSSVYFKGKSRPRDQVDRTAKTKKEKFENGDYDASRKIWSENAKNNNPMTTPEARRKSSEANKGKPKSEEQKAKISKTLKERAASAPKSPPKKFPNRKKRDKVEVRMVTCPYCGVTGGANGMPRWHFDKCKHKSVPLV
jgi:hypothetical protein